MRTLPAWKVTLWISHLVLQGTTTVEHARVKLTERMTDVLFCRRLLWSESGFRVVELRNPCGEVLHHWSFTEDQTCKSFKLPIQTLSPRTSENPVASKYTVVAIDANGNLLNRTVRGELLC